MKRKDDEPFKFVVRQVERVTVTVEDDEGIADDVAYSINGSETFPGPKDKTDPCTFSVDQRSTLVVTCFFTDEEGGKYTIRVKGEGLFESVEPYERSGKEAF